MANKESVIKHIVENAVDLRAPIPANQIPENWNSPLTQEPTKSVAQSILSQRMHLPVYTKPESIADQLLKSKMKLPELVDHSKNAPYIPIDWLDELPEAVKVEPRAIDVLLSSKMSIPTYVKPESVAERVLRTAIDTSHLQANRSFSDTIREIRESKPVKDFGQSLG